MAQYPFYSLWLGAPAAERQPILARITRLLRAAGRTRGPTAGRR